MIISYPRQCSKCKKSYSSKSTYSKHYTLGTCETTQSKATREAQNTNNVNGANTVIINNQFHDTQKDMKQLELQNKDLKELNERIIRENERLKAENLTGPLEKFDGGLYLVQTARFLQAKENVYKIGRSERFDRRLHGYEKGYRVVYFCLCADHVAAEVKLKQIFRERFTQRVDIGTEYFEGDIDCMIMEIQKLGGSKSL